jgi:hypothetical protein
VYTDTLGYCVILYSGSVECWGGDPYEEIGNGTSGAPSGAVGYDTPQLVVGISGVNFLVSDDYVGYCADLVSGGVDCWGDNREGQLGNGSLGGLDGTPQSVDGLTDVVAMMSDGVYGYCALSTSGTVSCWGFNSDGDLGNGVVGGPDCDPSGFCGFDSPQAVAGLRVHHRLIRAM